MGGKKILKCGIKRRKGCLYYIDKDGDICEVRMLRGGAGGLTRKKMHERKMKRLVAAKERNKKFKLYI